MLYPKRCFRIPAWRNLLTRLFPLLLLLLTAGCSMTGKQSTLDPKGPVARMQTDLFWITVYVCVGIFIVVGGALVWVVIKFREKPEDIGKPYPKSDHGNPLIEIGLIAVSVFLLVIIAVPTVRYIWKTHDLPVDEPYYETSKLGTWFKGDMAEGEEDNIIEINVYGWQWWWSFEYPQFGITTANEFTIPVGKVVKLNLRSVDVIHSFWLPKIAGKVDLMPGRKNWMWIMAEEEGHYYGQCAEFCGEAHAYMLFRSDVVSDQQFMDWIAKYQAGAAAPAGFQAQPDKDKSDPTAKDDWAAWSETARSNPGIFADDPVHQGAIIFMGKGQCIVCHAIDNSPAMGKLGPNLSHVASRKSLAAGILDNQDENGNIDAKKQYENLLEWISKSQHIKPGNLMYYNNPAAGNNAGLINMKYAGLTYARLASVGVTDKNYIKAGVNETELAAMKQDPETDITNFLSDNQIRRATKGLGDEQFAEISNWLSPQEFAYVAQYLQTLK